jgi:hypothetical protein
LATPFTRLKNKKGITAIHDRLGSWNGYAFDLQPFGSARQGGQGIDFPLPKFLIGRRSILLKWISLFPGYPFARNFRDPFRGDPFLLGCFGTFEFRICFGFRYSDFGFFDASNLFGSGYAGLGIIFKSSGDDPKK